MPVLYMPLRHQLSSKSKVDGKRGKLSGTFSGNSLFPLGDTKKIMMHMASLMGVQWKSASF